ncbi:CobW family GTP-binding protein [Roseibacillus persicicus]|uniref:CobW family GTP-binding protein n=1 Tax=Roseibacillus persicicus TaxID=454148 RepID=UPI00280DF5E3|nr:GTP-binding protein [Roseibacillus persicicus]MDQ8192375.1 GTP-binding protein [Roseibacillus persicicus]
MHSAILPDRRLVSLTPVRPMLMLTGFLGAGKTTLLRSLLNELSERGHLADVILNDMENALLDRETLREHAASVEPLTGSCVCCEGLDELCRMILEAAQSTHQLLLIELNGTADPLPLQETFTLLESKFLLHPRWQVCVIDARYFGQRSRFQELEKLQLETASHYYLSHVPGPSEEAEMEQMVRSINPGASRTTASDLAGALSDAILKNRGYRLGQAEERRGAKPSFDPLVHFSREHQHSRHHYAHEFTGCNIVFPEPVEPSRIQPWLKALPETVVRAKALIEETSDPDGRYLYERVGDEIPSSPIPVRSISKVPCSGLFIGPDLQPDELLGLTRELLHPRSHFPKK